MSGRGDLVLKCYVCHRNLRHKNGCWRMIGIVLTFVCQECGKELKPRPKVKKTGGPSDLGFN